MEINWEGLTRIDVSHQPFMGSVTGGQQYPGEPHPVAGP